MTVQLRFPRELPELGRREAEERLFAELDANAAAYATDTDFGLCAAHDAVVIVKDFLLSRGMSGQAVKIFGDLAGALRNVSQGILPEMFNPNADTQSGAEGRQVWSRSSKGEESDLYLAAVAEALHRTTKRKLSTIFAEVARRAQEWPRISSGEITAGRVKDARHKHLLPPRKRGDITQFELAVQSLSEGPNALQYLEDVLANGPPLTGGTRREKI
jgi:hypothetical protein